ncbi:MAG: hypothetical protein U1E35_07920 [Rhodospirillales bacterium]
MSTVARLELPTSPLQGGGRRRFHLGCREARCLQDPKAFVIANLPNKTTAMTACALKDPAQRADVIAYLQTLK